HLLQLLQTGADISMRAPLSSDAVVQEGEVYVQDVLSLFPYTSHLCVVELTGEQIYRMMEYSYGNWFGKMASLQDDLLAIEFDENSGKYELSQPHAQLFSFSGVNYTVDITKEGGDRITIRDLSDGSPFKMDETYTVVMDSKIILEMNGILRETGLDRSQIEQKIISVTALPFQYYLLDMLSQQNIVEPFSVGNWSIIPDVWFQRGLKNTYPKLFPGSSK
ncbi:MAG: 5'-nucleotidase C-terminal domain-containing protein, partial [Sphaerochaetaceae bacterium]